MLPSRTGRSQDSNESTADAELAQVLEGYLADLEAGRASDPEQLIAQHPAIADRLRACFENLQFIEQSTRTAIEETPTSDTVGGGGVLGDFRIEREIGRGGMGVVYEAEQISLGRRVALKVLPFAAALDQRQLQRFKNEALAAASLHHTNIVPVYLVGCERGVHYYAMDRIDGQTLAQVIDQLGPLSGRSVTAEPVESSSVRKLPSAIEDTPPVATLSTERSNRSPEFIRSVVRLAVQATEALEYAHEQGVVHRDIKPSNLMLDGKGHVWITDFGLAMTHGDSNLTMTGDLLGTLRYMSPEQASGRRVVLDHRTDIYSLGVTLYELLTLRPAFGELDRQKLLQQIVQEEPPSLRQLNKAIPRDLETIVLKTLAKEPQSRYATAQELADDLRRFLEDKPIVAKRPGLITRVRKWVKRHKAVVAFAAMAVLLLGVVLARRHQLLEQLRTAGEEAVTAAELSLAKGEYDLAAGRLVEAHSRLTDAPEALRSLTRRIEHLRVQAEAERKARRFRRLADEARSWAYFNRDRRKAGAICEEALASYSLGHATADDGSSQPQATQQLPAELHKDAFELLLILARTRFDSARAKDEQAKADRLQKALATLAEARELREVSPAVMLYRAQFLKRSGKEAAAVQEEQRAAETKPQTALDHFLLGGLRSGDSVAHYKSALQIEPDHAPSYMRLGQHYKRSKQTEQAELCFTACAALLPENPFVFFTEASFTRRSVSPMGLWMITPRPCSFGRTSGHTTSCAGAPTPNCSATGRQSTTLPQP